MNRTVMIIIFVLAVGICVFDVYAAIRGHGNNVVAWALGAMMAAFAVWVLTKLVRGETSL